MKNIHSVEKDLGDVTSREEAGLENPVTIRPFMLLLILWKIWYARNQKVFQGLDIDASTSVKHTLGDLIVWAHHLKTVTLMDHAGLWRDCLSSCSA